MESDEAPENSVVLKITWHNQSPANLLLLAGEWLEAENPDLALQYYESALRLEPDFTLAAWRYGHLALKQKRPQEAKEKLEASLLYLSDHAPTHYLLSLICDALNDDDDALHYVNQALLLNPLHSGAFLHKMRFLAKQQLWEELQKFLAHDIANMENAGEILLYRVLSQIHAGQKEVASKTYKNVPVKHRHRFPELAKRIEAALSS